MDKYVRKEMNHGATASFIGEPDKEALDAVNIVIDTVFENQKSMDIGRWKNFEDCDLKETTSLNLIVYGRFDFEKDKPEKNRVQEAWFFAPPQTTNGESYFVSIQGFQPLIVEKYAIIDVENL